MPAIRIPRSLNYVAVASIMVLAIAIATLAGSIYSTAQSWRWVVHTRDVLERLQETLTLVGEAEALQNALLLAPDAQDSADLRGRLERLPREADDLRRLTEDNPVQQRALGPYRQLLQEFASTIRANLAPGAPIERRTMRVLRSAILVQTAALRAEEQRLLAQRETSVVHARARTIGAGAAVAVLSIGLLLLVRSVALRDAATLRAGQARLDATLRSIGEAVIAVDGAGRVSFMNLNAERLAGMPEAQAAGRPFGAVLAFHGSGPDQPNLEHVVMATITSGLAAPRLSLSAPAPAGMGGNRDWLLTCHPKLLGGAPAGAVIALLDVTELKQSQRELAEANLLLERRIQERTRMLTEANIELRAFAHTVAHDLQAPLRNLEAYADALQQDEAPVLSEGGRRFVERIRALAARMDRLVSDLLDYSQLSRAELVPTPVALERVLDQALQDLGAQIASSAARVRVASPLPTVLGNQAILVQVFDNLIANAIKFVAPGTAPAVVVSAAAQADDGMAMIEVADNGIGIPRAERERVFGVFERLHGEEQYPGTGIGLAIVRKGIERMGGRVDVLDAPAGASGTVFRITLPLAPRGPSLAAD